VPPRPASTAALSDNLVLTPLEALHLAELARTRKFMPLTLMLGVLGLFSLLVMPGGEHLKLVVAAGTTVTLIAMSTLYVLAKHPAKFTELRVASLYGVTVLGVFTHIYYWGVFSAATMLVALGLFFVGLGNSERVSFILYLACGVIQGVLAVLIATGGIPDLGVLRPHELGVEQMVFIQFLIQIIYGVTYLVARASKRQSSHWVGELDREVRRSAQREALVLEVRQALDGALKVGGPGRFSEQTLGSFRLGTVIGRGGMGEIYDAVHVQTNEPAAVKLLNLGALANAGTLRRFLREAHIVAGLASHHVVKVLEIADPASTPVPYIAMERLVGVDLAQFLRERRLLSLAECDDLVTQIADGAAAAHAAGVTHRDLKPQNIFRTLSDEKAALWKILDFGVSKLGERPGTMTAGHVIGTPAYMPPEQASGQGVDHRADIYALAAVAYRSLTGRPPAAGRGQAVLHSVMYSPPSRPSRLADVPADVERVLAIGLAKQRDDRFASARELAEAFSAAVAGALSKELRERADGLLGKYPWG
jgi:serine/threonine-protein kinase